MENYQENLEKLLVRSSVITKNMAPQKFISVQQKSNANAAILPRRGISTRSQTLMGKNRAKRKAEASPQKETTTKRSALGNITNAIGKSLGAHHQEPKKVVKKPIQVKPVQQIVQVKAVEKVAVKTVNVPCKIKLPPRVKALKKEETNTDINKLLGVRRSLDLESDESSLYESALEDVFDSSKRISDKSNESKDKIQDEKLAEEENQRNKALLIASLDAPPVRNLPEGVQWDFDVENWSDPYQVSYYAMDIFNYLKNRESTFVIGDYIDRQVCLSQWMRALLVDWMVEVQESFELNHETLYLAVKLVDLYLTKVTVGKETLQLLGAASLFIASKYDERIPPMVEDFLYICDGAYTQRELIRMEMNVLKVIDFDLGIPLSYRFLRRYARCAKVTMPTLTLARYILEYSLMDYSTIRYSDSKMAAAALLLALQMKDLGGWNMTLEYYTGYRVEDIKDIVITLNEGLHKKHKEALTTVRNKYSHKIFFEVAKVPLKDSLNI